MRYDSLQEPKTNSEKLRVIANWLYGDAKEADELDTFDWVAEQLEQIAGELEKVKA